MIMRDKGYKCNNVKCDRCVGHSMCGELGDIALNCIDRIIARQTNAQKIRAMSDEELAKFMGRMFWCPVTGDCKKMSEDCNDCWLDWLQQPAE